MGIPGVLGADSDSWRAPGAWRGCRASGGQGLLCASVFLSSRPSACEPYRTLTKSGARPQQGIGSVCWMVLASSAPTCREVAAHQTIGGGVAEG